MNNKYDEEDNNYVPRHSNTYKDYNSVFNTMDNIENNEDKDIKNSDDFFNSHKVVSAVDDNHGGNKASDIPLKKSSISIDKKVVTENSKKKVRRKKRTLKKWVWEVFIIIFVIIIILSALKIFFWSKDNSNTGKIIDKISDDVDVVEQEDDDNTELIGEDEDKSSDYWYYITFPLINVDFTELKKKNADTIGWINVNNTNINYPFVQTTDNDYYLNHSFDKSSNEAGWVFMDYRNDQYFSDENTILYAHSRLDKTMFGSLSKVLSSSWYSNKDNHIIRLSTETENTLWQIFSVYKIKEESYYITTNFGSTSDYEEFLNTLKSRSIHDFNTNLTTSDKILTLSTCYSDTERTVVHAKLIKKSSK